MLSVIIPIHNEAAILAQNLALLKKALDSLGQDYEVLLAEDGSTDGSREMSDRFASKDIRFRVIGSEDRVGRGASLTRSIKSAKGDIIIYMDADLAADLSHMLALVSEIENGSDIATGSRLMKGSEVSGRSFQREISSKGYNLLIRLLFRTSLSDHQCGFKAFRRSSILGILDDIKDKHWFWDTELIVRSKAKGLLVSEIPIRWKDRKISRVDLSNDIAYMGASAIRLWFKVR
jgi:hypothetical protein